MHGKYSAEDLLMNDSFLKWCREPLSTEGLVWQQKVKRGEIGQDVVDEAKQLYTLLGTGLSEQEIAGEITKMGRLISEREKSSNVKISLENADDGEQELPLAKSGVTVRKRFMYLTAAVLTTVVLIAIFNYPAKQEHRVLAFTEISSGFGEQKKIQLPDGSTVVLNSNSSISIDENFNKKDRNLKLKGKAFFQVAKNQRKPFVITNNGFTTTVVGTSFYISGDNTDDYSVQLLEGKVTVNASDQHETTLEAGEQAKWLRSENSFSKTQCDTAYLHQWYKGELVFDKTPAEQAFRILQQWYGVTIEDRRVDAPGSLLNGRYKNAALNEILEVICFTLHCSTTIENNRIIIR